ncbi:vascular endothelial growth factor D [Protopterus annectens]|uniref:vascular endothelial growth factor D n=1 Tax=Protopterus annectens TaxID=7888 RepID=UPI001CFB597F|nr:vascular endothelial growth factor D [Protopterus annectens]
MSNCCPVFLLVFLQLLQGYEYNDYDTKQREMHIDMIEKLQAAGSVEELLQITYPEDWKLWKCRLKLKKLAYMDSRSSSHRSTRYAAAFRDLEILSAIEEEWEKTMCKPRETCVNVAKELGVNTNTFFKPPCVSVFRCGGCCNEESLACINMSMNYVSKTLFQISVHLSYIPEPVTVSIVNHTMCRCLSDMSRHPKPVIRRSVLYEDEYDSCSNPDRNCDEGLVWDNTLCECVPPEEAFEYVTSKELNSIGTLALCGPYLDFDEDLCDCVCRRSCPRHHLLNPENCTCECKESAERCSQRHKLFNPYQCRCY